MRRIVGILARPGAVRSSMVASVALLALGLVAASTHRADPSQLATRMPITITTTTTVIPDTTITPVTSTLPAPTTTGSPPTAGPTSTPAPPVTAPPPTAAAIKLAGPIGPVTLTGCPPPPRPPQPPSTPSHPPVLVPESAFPVPPPPAPRVSDLRAIDGKGMWIWQAAATESGNVDAIVNRAVAAHLGQLWVRVGSSFDGFYGTTFLDALVPLAHRRGLSVVGWGFPYLYDPVGDAGWTGQALAWSASTGDRLDAWSADIEAPTEGVALSARRAATYLGLIRPHMGGRPLIATVYPPTDYWMANYPYPAMAPVIDAFAPMVYWSCREPGDAAAEAISRLRPLAPVHPIGQAFDLGPDGGRVGSPSGAEIARFLDVARRGGAAGASFWVWQSMSPAEWSALAGYPWAPPTRA